MLRFPVSSLGDKKPLFATSAVVAVCWILLAVWEVSPYSGYLHHQSLSGAPLSEMPFLTVAFAGGWILMIGAMMIPTIFPLLMGFRSVAWSRTRTRLNTSLFLGGFICIWLCLGIALFFSDFWLHKAVEETYFLAQNSFLIPSTTIATCGVYQFSRTKQSLLGKCRQSPDSIQVECLQCSSGRDSLRSGLRHGYFSVGACGTFMILMFAADIGNLWSMSLLGAVMIVERYHSSVDRFVSRFGFGMIGLAVVYALVAAGGV